MTVSPVSVKGKLEMNDFLTMTNSIWVQLLTLCASTWVCPKCFENESRMASKCSYLARLRHKKILRAQESRIASKWKVFWGLFGLDSGLCWHWSWTRMKIWWPISKMKARISFLFHFKKFCEILWISFRSFSTISPTVSTCSRFSAPRGTRTCS